MKKLIMALVLMPLMALADTEIVNGIEWKFTISDGKATLSRFYWDGVAEIAEIPSILGGCPVTSIGARAFYGCSGLTSVTIPEGVTSIGARAFYGCCGLTSVTIPSSVTSIGDRAFGYCDGLADADGFVIVCGVLSDYLGRSWMETPVHVTIPERVLIPECVTSIGSSVFSGCFWLKSVTIPSSVTSIGNSAFADCRGLTSVTIPSSVTSIGSSAFSDCTGLTSVTISSNVTSIGGGAFSNCRGLTSISVDDDNALYCSLDGALYDDDKTVLLACPGGKTGAFEIPSSVTSIGESAFSGCSRLTSVTIPEGVTSIGEGAFSDCSGLTSVTIPEGVTSIGERAFSWCSGLTSVTILEGVTSIGECAFLGCSGLTSVTISEGVTSIGDEAFESCFGLMSVTIPSSVASIGNGAFNGCLDLTSVTINEGTMSIGDSAFQDCSGLKSVTIPSSVISVGSGVFYGCSGLKSIFVDDGNALYCSQDGVLYDGDKTVLLVCPGGKTGAFEIPSSVTSIADWAFYGCRGLMSVTIPSSVTSCGWDVFEGCSGLMSVTFGDGLTTIGGAMFYGCSGLKSVAIPESATNIGNSAFADCSGLTSVTIPSSVTSIDNAAFASCDSIQVVFVTDKPQDCVKRCFGDQMWYQKIGSPIQYEWEIGDEGGSWSSCTISGVRPAFGDIVIPSKISGIQVTSIGESAFSDCIGLTSVTIPSSVTSIGVRAFFGCSGLKSVIIPSSVTSVESLAFYECSGLTSVTLPLKLGSVRSLFPSANGIKSVTWIDDGSMTSVPAYACSGLTELEQIVIPANVMNVGDQAFYNCHQLKSVIFEGNAPDVGTEVFNGTPKDLVLSVPTGSVGWDGGITSTALPSTWGGRAIAHVGESYDWSKGTTAPAAAVAGSSVTVSNVVVHYILNSVQPQFAIQPADDMNFVNIVTEVKGSAAVAIPETWAANYPGFAEKFGTDFTQALLKPTGKIGTGGTPMLVWQDYVAGTDPTNEKDVFTASITIVDGKVTISYTPELDDARKAMRKYTTWGKTSLMDTDWTEVQEGHEAEFNFFKVSVEMR